MTLENNYRIDMKTLVPDLISYIISIGPMLMSPQVSIVRAAAVAAGADIFVWKGVKTDDATVGGYQARFNDVTDRAWKYTWNVYKMDQLPGTGVFRTKMPKIPEWNWENVANSCGTAAGTYGSSGVRGAGEDTGRAAGAPDTAGKAGAAGVSARSEWRGQLLRAVEKEIQSVLRETLEKAKLPWEERWDEDRIASTSANMIRVFFGKLYMEILGDDMLRPYQDHQNMLAGIHKVHESLDAQQKEHGWMIAELQEIHKAVDLLFLMLQERFDKKDTYSPINIDVSTLNSIRKLSDGLWINWRTGWLAKDRETALSGIGAEEYDTLSSDELRLLSILIQGEGALVRWEEIDARRSIGEENSRTSETAGDTMRKLLSDHPMLEGIVWIEDKGCRMAMDLALPDDIYEDICGKTKEGDYKSLGNVNDKKMCTDTQAWLRRYYNQTCQSFERISNAMYTGKEAAEAEIFGNYSMAEIYMNAYAVEHSSGEGSEDKAAGVMLDYVEKWHRKGERGSEGIREQQTRERRINRSAAEGMKYGQFGRVLVLHGQPGDGKTTFCKKAVYAHCKEGWLQSSSQVLRISLNPSDHYDSGGREEDLRKVISNGKLFLKRMFCLKEGEEIFYVYDIDTKVHSDSNSDGYALEGALVIFDGYDELSSALAATDNAKTFRQFCEKVSECARKYHFNAIVTSRTACIEGQLDEVMGDNVEVASFAPMNRDQQEAMVQRMIELDKDLTGETEEGAELCADTDGDYDGGRRLSLEAYRNGPLQKYWEYEKYRKDEKDSTYKDIHELLKIPSLFRMIVAMRFDVDRETKKEEGRQTGTRTRAWLYDTLFGQLWEYKYSDRSTAEKEQEEYGKNYEKMAAKMFCYDGNIGPFTAKDDVPSGLSFKFFTRRGTEISDETETIGFLGLYHKSFYDYFLARFIISGMKNVFCDADREELFEVLSVSRITDQDMWNMVAQTAELEASRGRKPFAKKHIEGVLKELNREGSVSAFGLSEGRKGKYIRKDGTDRSYLLEAETAVFNLLGACCAAEKGCLSAFGMESTETSRIPYGPHDGKSGFVNICKLLQRGDYSGIYLEGANLAGCDLKNACLAGAYLEGASLVGAGLESANLKGVRLAGVHLEGARLPGANLSVAYLQGAHLDGCNLNYANLQKAHLQGAFLRKETTLRRANLVCADLKEAHLEGADLTGAFLTTAHLEGAHLESANLTGAFLTTANLEGANLEGADLIGAFLTTAHLEGAHLEGADLRSAHLETAIMSGTFLEGANLQWAHLDNAYLKEAHFGESRLDDASLKGAYLIGAELSEVRSGEGANIDGAYVTEEQLTSLLVQDMVGTPETVQARMARLRKEIREGKKVVLFGYYPQGAKGEILPLRWIVLTVVNKPGGKQALMITGRLVDSRPYHDVMDPVMWENCSLRTWLNEEFFQEAFCKEEQLWIARKEIPNPDNPRWIINGCEPTPDSIFALSLEEAENFFFISDDRMAAVTPYAIKKGALTNKNYKLRNGEEVGWWWLCSLGYYGLGAASVGLDGGISLSGGNVSNCSAAVRPALWLNLESEIF